MSRQLNVSPEIAQHLHSAHLAHGQALANRDIDACAVCGQPVLGPAELVIFRDQGYEIIWFAHPDCLASGIYDRPGMRARAEAAEGWGKTDLRVLLLLLPSQTPRGVCAVEPLLLRGSSPDTDPVENFAMRLGLPPLNAPAKPQIVMKSRLRVGEEGLEVVTGKTVRSLGSNRAAALDWIKEADTGLAWLIVGRGMDLDHAQNIQDLIAGAACWGAPLRAERPGRGGRSRFLRI